MRKPSLPRLVSAWLDTLRSPHTQAAYRADLDRFSGWCAEHAVDPLAPDASDLTGYRRSCEDAGWSPASVARRLSAVGSFLRYASEHGASGAADAYASLEHPTTAAHSPTPALSRPDATALLEAADALNVKTALVVRLLMLDGLKVGEAVDANANDLSGRPPASALRLVRQGDPHVIRLHVETGAAARAYLQGRRSGPLLVGDGPSRAEQRLTRFGIDYMLKRAATTAGLPAGVSANMLRRYYVTTAHADGTDLDVIRRHAGHLDERTTRRYLPDPAPHAERGPGRRDL